jgi:hypothetical protein
MVKSVTSKGNFNPSGNVDEMQQLAVYLQSQLANTTVVFDATTESITILKAYEFGDETSVSLKDLVFTLRDDAPCLYIYTLDFFVKNKNSDYVRSGVPDPVVIAKLGYEFEKNQLNAKLNVENSSKKISFKFPDPAVIDPISEAYSKKYSTYDKEKLFSGLKIGWGYAFQKVENTFNQLS